MNLILNNNIIKKIKIVEVRDWQQTHMLNMKKQPYTHVDTSYK